MRRAAAAVFLLLSLRSTVHAQEGPPPEALQYFESGRQHYNAGQYEDAARDLEHALELDPDSPTLIFNLSKVYELMGPSRIDDAIAYAERYQQMLPPEAGEERGQIETMLLRLQGARAYFEQQAQGPSELRGLDDTVYVQSRGVADKWFWLCIAGGSAVAGIAILTGVVALGRRSAHDDRVLSLEQNPSYWDSYATTTRRFSLATDFLVGISAALFGTAALLYYRRSETYELGEGGTLEETAEDREDRDDERDEDDREPRRRDDRQGPPDPSGTQWFDVSVAPSGFYLGLRATL